METNVRKVIFVPILHSEADFGRLSRKIVDRYKMILGEEKWEKRQRMLSSFWKKISDYFADKDVSGMRIYQDGLIVGEELGKEIVWKAAEAGSLNYKLIKHLIMRGAMIEKTEDIELIKTERDYIVKMITPKSPFTRLVTRFQYTVIKDRLLEKRDTFIANQINHTLKEGETGILFLGARHNVLPKLSKDIVVEKLLEREDIGSPKRSRSEQWQENFLCKLMSGELDVYGDAFQKSDKVKSCVDTWYATSVQLLSSVD